MTDATCPKCNHPTHEGRCNVPLADDVVTGISDRRCACDSRVTVPVLGTCETCGGETMQDADGDWWHIVAKGGGITAKSLSCPGSEPEAKP